MSESGVDLSQIRGDWKFHIDYLQNAVDRTLERQAKYRVVLGEDAALGTAVDDQARRWAALRAAADARGTIPTADEQLPEFIAACRDAKPLCDALQDRDDGENAEEFAEACRQLRALCDDLEMMIGQRPDDL